MRQENSHRTDRQPASRSKLPQLVPLACVAALGASVTAHGEGFRNPPSGTFGLGRAGARIAQIDNASAIANNPANLMDLPRLEIIGGLGLVYIETDFDAATGMEASTKDPWKFLPNFFVAGPVYEDRVALGLGVTVPYGLSNEWETSSGAFADQSSLLSLRYNAAHFAELKTINVNPTVAARILDNLTLGAGLNVMYGDLELRQFFPWGFLFPMSPDGLLKAEGDGFGFGGNVGLTWEITKRQRLAVTYRSPICINFDGDFSVSNVPMGVPLPSRVDFDTHIEFPTIIGVGYGVQVTDTIRLEANFEWLEFSNFDELPLNSSLVAPLGLPTSIPQNWKDTFTAGIGGDWQFAPNWILRASYWYLQSPVPSRTLSPAIPDANQNAITVGLGYRYRRHFVDAAFSEVFYDKRNISNNVNPAFNGEYETTVHLFAFSYRFVF